MKHHTKQEKYLIGIDEAGRGPLAGPLVMCGILSLSEKGNQIINQCYDSKQTKETERERLFEQLTGAKNNGHVDFYVSIIDASIIDLVMMRGALRLAAKEILEYFLQKYGSKIVFQIDGKHDFDIRKYNFHVDTFVKGDSLIQLISAASIIAKVTRDTIMIQLDQTYSHYGFSQHKGYGTKKHRDTITVYGLSELHRKSFCSKFMTKL